MSVNAFYSTRAFVSTADIDQNSLQDIWVSMGMGYQSSTVLWNFPTSGDVLSKYSYADRYTYPRLPYVQYSTLGWGCEDPLCDPPGIISAWFDLTGDGLADNLRLDNIDVINSTYALTRNDRSGAWPFTLQNFMQDIVLTSHPSGNPVQAMGTALVDMDRDGIQDVVTGAKSGQILYYRNTTLNGSLSLADPITLSDSSGTPIDVGWQSWPTAIDLNGDDCIDFLVGEQHGNIYKIICTQPGSPKGYLPAELLGSLEQNPINVTHEVGGGIMTPSLTTIDINNDGLDDVLMADSQGRIWMLKNVGSLSSAIFSLSPVIVSQTSAAYLEILDARHIRLYFAIPTIFNKTVLSYHSVPTAGSVISGKVTLNALP